MLILEILAVLLTLYYGIITPNVFLCCDHHPQAEGLIEVKQTYSCCTSLEVVIHKDEGCEDRFSIWDMPFALVKGPHAEVQAPFRLLRGGEAIQVLDCVDFSHQRVCDLEDIYVEEKIIHYESVPCTQDV